MSQRLREVDVEPVVPVDQVVARARLDHIRTGSACDLVAPAAAVDERVATTAVDDDRVQVEARVEDALARCAVDAAAAGDRLRRGVVVVAVLRGVAEHHQRRVEATAAARGDAACRRRHPGSR